MKKRIIAITLMGLGASISSFGQSYRSSAPGGTETTIVSKQADKTIYRVQSNEFPSHLFSQADLADLAHRVNRRNCSDSDIMTTMRSGHVFQYDFYGADRVKVGSFFTTGSICRSQFGAR